MRKPKRSPAIGAGQSLASQDQATETSLVNEGQGLRNTAQGTLSQFEGPVQDSPFYKALYNTGVQSTSDQYQSARSNMRARANAAGYGGADQPIEKGAEGQLDVAEGKSLANVGPTATIAAADKALPAAAETASIGASTAGTGTTIGGQGADYFKSVVPLEQQYQDQLFKQQQAMWNSLSQLPEDLALAGG